MKKAQVEVGDPFHQPVYNVDDYSKVQLQVFTDTHSNVRERLQATSEAMCLQHIAFVMLRVPERHSKLSLKFVGPRQIVRQLGGNKIELYDLIFNSYEIVHSDRLK